MHSFVRNLFTLRETHSFWERYIHYGRDTFTLREVHLWKIHSLWERYVHLREMRSFWERYAHFGRDDTYTSSRAVPKRHSFISGHLGGSCWSLWEWSGALGEETSQHVVKLTIHSLAFPTIHFLCFSWSQLPGKAPRTHIYTKYQLCAWHCRRYITSTMPFSPKIGLWNNFKMTWWGQVFWAKQCRSKTVVLLHRAPSLTAP